MFVLCFCIVSLCIFSLTSSVCITATECKLNYSNYYFDAFHPVVHNNIE
jgi:hypothetical protein